MNRQDLKQLDKLKHLSPKELREKAPELADSVLKQLGESAASAAGSSLPEGTEEIQEVPESIGISLDPISPEVGLLEAVVEELQNQGLDHLVEDVKEAFDEADTDISTEEAAGASTPIALHPEMQETLRQARVYRVADAFYLPGDVDERLVERGTSFDDLDEATVDQMVEEGTLGTDEAEQVAAAASTYRVLDERPELVSAVQNYLPEGIDTPNRLARMSSTDWREALKEGEVSPPQGLSREEYASALQRVAANTYPTAALSGWTQPSVVETALPELQMLEVMSERAPREPSLDEASFDAVDTEELSPDEVESLKQTWQNTARLTNRFPGLGIGSVLTETDRPNEERFEEVQRRVSLANEFLERNLNQNVLRMDLSAGGNAAEQLNFEGIDDPDRSRFLSMLKTYQRAYATTDDVVDARSVVEGGLHSAVDISKAGEKDVASRVDVEPERARRIFRRGKEIATKVSGAAGVGLDVWGGGFDDLEVGNIPEETTEYLADLPGFQEFFGNQDYCDCDHCSSVLSPSAYFVDLMDFVGDNVTSEVFTGDKSDHPLKLRNRRPDLWTLELSCENTKEVIPTLEILNEILENAVARRSGFSGDFDDRTAVRDIVYRDQLNTATDSFLQPFHLALEKLSIYLGHFDHDLGSVAGTLSADKKTSARLRLELSPEEWDLITQSDTNISFLERAYDLSFSLDSGTVEPFDVQDMLPGTDLGREELGSIVKTSFVTADGSEPIEIRSTKSSQESVQNDVEEIRDLRPSSLDRIHRFTRLWRVVPWEVGELDVVLSHIQKEQLASGLDADALKTISRLLDLQEALDSGVEELISFWSTMPDTKAVGEARSFLDRTLNTIPDLPELPNGNETFKHPAFQSSSATGVNPFLQALTQGTGLNQSQLHRLLVGLSKANVSNFNEKNLALNASNLTLLYRHARLAALLELKMDVLFHALRLSPKTPDGHVKTLEELKEFVDWVHWWRSTRLSLDALAYITGRGKRPDDLKDPVEAASKIVDQVQSDGLLRFANTIFAFLPNVTEEDSREILRKNSGLTEEVEGQFRLKPDVNLPGDLTVPSSIQVSKSKIVEALRSHTTESVLRSVLSEQLGIESAKLDALVNLEGADLGHTDFAKILRGDTSSTSRLESLVKALLPLTVLFEADVFAASTLAFIDRNRSVFGSPDVHNLTFADVKTITDYQQWVDELDDEDHREALQAILKDFSSGYGSASTDDLGTVLDASSSLVSSLVNRLSFANNRFTALRELKNAVELAEELGVGGAALGAMLSTDHGDLADAASSIEGAFRAKYDDEEEWKKNVRPFNDKLRSRKRDGLVEYLLRSAAPQFDEVGDLYEYYLIDVKLEGCARTSRVVAANSALQLYVQRVLMSLEQTSEDAEEAVHVDPDLIPKDKWEWMKRYRLWEANRKIFLHPENYLEPGLRDNKTPLFEELEENLLSREIDEQSVRKAYAKYLRGFQEVAGLDIAGAYHEKDAGEENDVLHLFGATSDDPPQYYYRRVENAEYAVSQDGRDTQWGHWEPIKMQIPVRQVSPVVDEGRLYVFWVNYVTQSQNKVQKGTSNFVGYEHEMRLHFSYRREDGTWSEPQAVNLENRPFNRGDGIIWDPIEGGSVDEEGEMRTARSAPQIPRYAREREIHKEPRKGYTLSGFPWDIVYPVSKRPIRLFDQGLPPKRFLLRGRDFQMVSELNLYDRSVEPIDTSNLSGIEIPVVPDAFPSPRFLWSNQQLASPKLYSGTATNTLVPFESYTFASLVIERSRARRYLNSPQGAWTWAEDLLKPDKYDEKNKLLLTVQDGVDVSLTPVNGSSTDCFMNIDGALFYLQEGAREDDKYHLRRLNTELAGTLRKTLFQGGVSELLATGTQVDLGEPELPFDLESQHVNDAATVGEVNFNGPLGAYFREIFFHIPVLIANHLNSQQKFEEAQKWYHYVFDPTASPLENNADDEEDRNWRYREFRQLDPPSLRDQLAGDTAEGALEAYKENPFNPHAVARQRFTAYQKATVMKYVDNLLDWGDDLFARDTREAINEASLLYKMASDILGDRPAELGDCGEKRPPRTYETVHEAFDQDDESSDEESSDFLAEIETTVLRKVHQGGGQDREGAGRFEVLPSSYVYRMAERAYPAAPIAGETVEIGGDGASDRNIGELAVGGAISNRVIGRTVESGNPVTNESIFDETGYGRPVGIPDLGIKVVEQASPVFCIPNNERLLDYWDRVEDRLFKIRHCMNIEGVKRQLALFAPPVEPGLLARARAAGLSPQEALDTASGELPPYRFRYLVNKARQYVQTVKGFGTSLLSAVEKRDAEELAQIENTHRKNVLKLVRNIKKQEIEAAKKEKERLNQQKEKVEARRDRYKELTKEKKRIAEETKQIERQKTARDLTMAAGVLDTATAITYLVPEVGSPFAMKFGGKQLGSSSGAWSQVLRTGAEMAQAVSTASGMIADFKRRDSRWKYQLDQAKKQLDVIRKRTEAAEIREKKAEKALEVHEKKQEQLDEVIDYYEDKFSDLGLYTWLSDELQQLYRDAYNEALGFVRLAEEAYRFERDDNTVFLEGGVWEASRSGLLAGERLEMALNRMEQKFIETNDRQLEITQSFSLSQINPAALIELKQTGQCNFSIPEFFFDLYYPGHYRRRIKAVRLTIPSVTGPYTNVSAKLSLTGSYMRKEANLDKDLASVPPTRSPVRTTSVAMSSAQDDSGVFNLNFDDERYMPFEGAGAISDWELRLPSNLRPFDYSSINDVIINISYTAEEDTQLRKEVEGRNGQIEGKLKKYLSNNSLTRVLSLRQEFSNAFRQLVERPKGTPVEIEISEKHFPFFLEGRPLKTEGAALIMDVEDKNLLSDTKVEVGTTSVKNFTANDSSYGGLPHTVIDSALPANPRGTLELMVVEPGKLAPDDSDAVETIDTEELGDILLVIDYNVS